MYIIFSGLFLNFVSFWIFTKCINVQNDMLIHTTTWMLCNFNANFLFFCWYYWYYTFLLNIISFKVVKYFIALFSDSLLLLQRIIIDFCILILYLSTLLDYFVSSYNSFFSFYFQDFLFSLAFNIFTVICTGMNLFLFIYPTLVNLN